MAMSRRRYSPIIAADELLLQKLILLTVSGRAVFAEGAGCLATNQTAR